MHHVSYNRNGYVRNRGHRPMKSGGNNVHNQQAGLINPNSLAYSMQSMTMVDSAPANSVLMVNSDGIPVLQKSESDSISSGESIDNTSPPDTPLTSNVHTSNSNVKSYKHRNDPNLISRHKMNTQNIIYGQMVQPPQSVSSSVQSQISLANDMIMSSNISQLQSQPSQQQQQQPTINLNLGAGNSSNLVTSTVLIANKATSSAMPAGFSIAGNPSVIFQQYPPQQQHHIQQGMQQTQLNTTYHYHPQHLSMNNRGSILTTPNTTTAGQQTTYRLPPYHMPPNGEVIYPFPSTIAYMQTTAMPLSRPSNHPQSHAVLSTQAHPSHQPIPAQPQPQPQPAPIMSKQPSPMNAYPPAAVVTPEAKAGTSCFNCGSHTHTGRECQEASMEDAARSTIYKLDYNSTILNEGKAGELDIGSNIENTDSSASAAVMK